MAIVAVSSLLVACAKDPGSKAAFCREARRAPDLSATLNDFSQADSGELRRRLTAASDAYERLADAAPKQIRGDTRSVVDLVDEVIGAVRDHPDDPEAVTDQVRKVATASPKVAEATKAVNDYASKECNVELDPSQAPASAPAATTTTTG